MPVRIEWDLQEFKALETKSIKSEYQGLSVGDQGQKLKSSMFF